MLTASEVKVHIQLAMQTAGDPVMGARLDNIAFYFQGYHGAVLGRPAFEGDILISGGRVTLQPSSRSDQLCLHSGDKLRPAPLPADSERLLWAVLAHYAPLPPFTLHQLVQAEPAVVAAQARNLESSTAARTVGREDLAESFSQKQLPEALIAAGFAKQPYCRPKPVTKELSEDERFALAAVRVAETPAGEGENRFRQAVDLSIVLIAEFKLAIQGTRLLREWCARCSPPIVKHESDMVWRAAKRYVSAIQYGASAVAEQSKYQYIPEVAPC